MTGNERPQTPPRFCGRFSLPNMSLKIEFDRDDLRPLVQLAVAEALDRLEAERAKFNARLAFTEPEAAVLLGVKPHVLRDCRRRGELDGAKVGSRILYTRPDLLDFLERQKENP
jgi:hypothetical protein